MQFGMVEENGGRNGLLLRNLT